MQFSSLIVLVALFLVHSHVAYATSSVPEFKCDDSFIGACTRQAVPDDANHPSIINVRKPGKSLIVTLAKEEPTGGQYTCLMRTPKDFVAAYKTPYCCRDLPVRKHGQKAAVSPTDLKNLGCLSPQGAPPAGKKAVSRP